MTRRGFTLVEVLATLVLIGIVVPVAMRAMSAAVDAAGEARSIQEASQLAESKLNEVLAAGDLQRRSTAGTFEHRDRYAYEIDSSPADFGCERLTVTVTWQRRGEERSLTMTTLLYPRTEDAP
jgi:prepilin-type N-terminal cleavage/methylation domain-containing protein